MRVSESSIVGMARRFFCMCVCMHVCVCMCVCVCSKKRVTTYAGSISVQMRFSDTALGVCVSVCVFETQPTSQFLITDTSHAALQHESCGHTDS